MKNTFLLFISLLLLISLNVNAKKPPTVFRAEDQPAAPDYSNGKYWSALPFRKDAADMIPKSETWINDSLKKVDVFYIYPTLYMKGNTWNASLDNKKLNKRLDNLPVKYHGSVFNAVGRVYAPRYRQSIIDVFSDSTDARKQSLDFAYQDVKKAFEYYMQHYNNGRPIIIASHSQGSTHARQLIKDFFDTPEMKPKLVCAYVVGFAMYPDEYKVLTPCKDADEINCYVTWASFKNNYTYKDTSKDLLVGKVCVNPISWKMNDTCVTGKGGFLFNENRKKLYHTDAVIHNNYLWVNSRIPIFRHVNILHFMDYNLYWYDIRKNVSDRVDAYFKK